MEHEALQRWHCHLKVLVRAGWGWDGGGALLVLIYSQPFVSKSTSHCATSLTNLPNQACGCMPAQILTDPNRVRRLQPSARAEDQEPKPGGRTLTWDDLPSR